MAQTQAQAADSTAARGQIFLSYSRGDNLSFADQLAKGLETYGGFRVSIDRNSIVGGEAWEARTTQLIQTADTIIFALSPESVASHFCNWEIGVAGKTGKRILTVVNHAIDDDSVPAALRSINRIYFYPDPKVPGAGFVSGLMTLIEALSIDLGWIREHSQLAEAAARWDANGRDPSDLYAGARLARALDWRNARPANAPEITTLQNTFLDAGETHQNLKNNAARRLLMRTAAATVAGIVVLALLGVATLLSTRRNADTNAALFSELSQGAFDADNYTAAMRWALAGLHLGNPEDSIGHRLAAIRLGEASRLQPLRRTWQPWPNESDLPADVVLSNDDKKIAVVSSLQVRVLDAESFAPTGFVLTSEEAGSFRVSFSPDGKRLLVTKSLGDTWARIYDVETAKVLTSLAVDSPDNIPCVQFAPDGKTVLTAHFGGFVQIWDAATGARRLSLDKHFAGMPLSEGNTLNCAAFSPDGSSLVTAGNDGTAKLWNARTGARLGVFNAGSYANDAAVSPDGRWLVVAGANGVATVFDTETESILARLAGHDSGVMTVKFSRDGSLAMTLSTDGTAKLWSIPRAITEQTTFDVANAAPTRLGPLRMTLKSGDGALTHAALATNKRVFTSERGMIRTWASHSWDAAQSFPVAAGRRIEIAPRGQWLVAFSSDPQVPDAIWEITAKGPRHRVDLERPREGTAAARVSADGSRVLEAFVDGSVALFDAQSGKLLQQFDVRRASSPAIVISPPAIAIAPDAKRVAIGIAIEDFAVLVFDAQSAALIQRFKGNEGLVHQLYFSDADTVVSGTPDGRILTWNVIDGALEKPEIDLKTTLAAIDISADGRSLVATDGANTIRLWDVETGRERWRSAAHLDIAEARLSPDGRSILSWSLDNTAKIWDVLTGQHVSVLPHDASVLSAAWTERGTSALTLDDNGNLKTWDLNALFAGDEATRTKNACATLSALGQRSFRPDEMARPILRGRPSSDSDPCTNQGPLTLGWWLGR